MLGASPLNKDTAQFFGSNGGSNETGTTAKTGDWCAITMLTDTVFSVLTERGFPSSDAITGITIPAGVTIFNALGISAFTLTSGAVRAYNR
jgi:hypothetical protein